MTDWVLTFGIVVVGVIVGLAVYGWVKAELDERTWRRIMREEGTDPGQVPLYRMLLDEGRDRE